MSLTNLSQLFASVYCILNGVEWLFLSIKVPDFFSDRDLRTIRLSEKKTIYYILKRLKLLPLFVHEWLSITGSFLLIVLGLVLAINSTTHWEIPYVCFAALIAQLLYSILWGTGLEGSDQIATIVLFSLSLLQVFPEAKYVI